MIPTIDIRSFPFHIFLIYFYANIYSTANSEIKNKYRKINQVIQKNHIEGQRPYSGDMVQYGTVIEWGLDCPLCGNMGAVPLSNRKAL
jgi:hypothetical protein